MKRAQLPAAFLAALVLAGPAFAADGGDICTDCITVRVGPPTVVRGPFPDELDAPFAALRLPDGTFRGFSANGATYAIEGASLADMAGPRRAVLEPGAPGSLSDCGRWLTSILRMGDRVLGLVHQEGNCDYNEGRTHKSMAIATSSDDGLTWTEPETIITGRDAPQAATITGEGDCTMVDGRDGFLYAYCLRNSDWQTIVARAPASDPTVWHKYYDGAWSEPGLGGNATAIGFIGPSAGYLEQPGWVATLATDRWFGGLRLAVSSDKVSFADLDEPLLAIDDTNWDRPADTDLSVYSTVLNPEDGSNAVNQRFVLAYIYVPPGKGFESRYLVEHEVTLSLEDAPQAIQAGLALTRWSNLGQETFVTSSGPLTGDRLGFRRDTVVAYLLTRAPENIGSVKLEECSNERAGHLDHLLAEDGSCVPAGYVRERTAGWLFATEVPGAVPVYRCRVEGAAHFASSAPDCEGLGTMEVLLGYGLAP